jgi:hypothetical protein
MGEMNCLLTLMAASLPSRIASFTLSAPNFTITESVSLANETRKIRRIAGKTMSEAVATRKKW